MNYRNILRRAAALVTVAALAVTLVMPAVTASAKSVTVLDNAYTQPGDDSSKVAVQGEYMTDQQAALDQINAYRKEACDSGYPDPRDPSRQLTPADYVPIKWAGALEYYARIRACEASVYTEHSRPGTNVTKPGVDESQMEFGSAETLAWPGGTLKGGVEQWYDEKEDWIKQNNEVTGHYTSMIDPDNIYCGIGGFLTDEGLGSGWGGCVCGRFISSDFMNYDGISGFDESFCADYGTVKQIISVKKSYLSGLHFTVGGSKKKKLSIYKGDRYVAAVTRTARFDNGDKAEVLPVESCRIRSSSPSVVKVKSGGIIKARKKGKATLTAVMSSGRKFRKKITVKKLKKYYYYW